MILRNSTHGLGLDSAQIQLYIERPRHLYRVTETSE
jgi:hypothetical protein